MTLRRYAEKVNADPNKKVILDSIDGDLSIQAHLDELMTSKNDVLSDVEYLAQTLDYQTFVEYNCQRAQLFYQNCVKQVW